MVFFLLVFNVITVDAPIRASRGSILKTHLPNKSYFFGTTEGYDLRGRRLYHFSGSLGSHILISSTRGCLFLKPLEPAQNSIGVSSGINYGAEVPAGPIMDASRKSLAEANAVCISVCVSMFSVRTHDGIDE